MPSSNAAKLWWKRSSDRLTVASARAAHCGSQRLTVWSCEDVVALAGCRCWRRERNQVAPAAIAWPIFHIKTSQRKVRN